MPFLWVPYDKYKGIGGNGLAPSYIQAALKIKSVNDL